MLEIAIRVVKDYGKVLGKAQPGMYGLPESLLPHSREQIRSAIRYLLENLGAQDPDIQQSLVQGYVYLAQFVPDGDEQMIRNGQRAALSTTTDGSGDAHGAIRLINQIKLAMEKALNEITPLVQG